MSDRSHIEWTDATWNPVTGCTKVSAGCDNCYAETLAERFRGTPGHYYEHGFDVQLRPEKLDQPLRWRRPRRIFVNSMSDLFHGDVPDEYIAKVFAVMALAPQHTFQVLTKRHGRMRSLLSAGSGFSVLLWAEIAELADDFQIEWPLPNVWIGVSAENQQWADIRIPALLDTPAAVRFVSAEPLLGPIDLRQSLKLWTPPEDAAWRSVIPPLAPGLGSVGDGPMVTARLDARDVLQWVIVGGESGRGARPMHPDWARSLRDQCQAAGVAFLFKQWGEWQPYPVPPRAQLSCKATTHHMVLPDGSGSIGASDFRSYSDSTNWDLMQRVGKKAAGRELDGRTWDQFPEAVAP